MKRVIFCIIGWVLVLGLHAQIVENMRIYTDKDCYVAGEDLWIKVCVTDSLSRGSVLSKVAYVEISDTKLVYAQGKIDLQNGNGWGTYQTSASHAYRSLPTDGIYALYEELSYGLFPKEVYSLA